MNFEVACALAKKRLPEKSGQAFWFCEGMAVVVFFQSVHFCIVVIGFQLTFSAAS